MKDNQKNGDRKVASARLKVEFLHQAFVIDENNSNSP